MKKGFSAKVNEDIIFDTTELTQDLNVIRDGDGFHVLDGTVSYRAEVISADEITKKYTLKINGTSFEVELEDEYDRLVDKMGLSALSNQKINDIKAPMPGLVLELMVKVGDTIAKGDPVLILEAMKMENVLKAPGEGIVSAIEVDQGAAVDKGQVLIKID